MEEELRARFLAAMKKAMLLGTPSPDPRQLMKAPARATLSPKGKREEPGGDDASPLAPLGAKEEGSGNCASPLSPLGERGRGVRGL